MMVVRQSAYTVVTITTTTLSYNVQTAVGLDNKSSALSLFMHRNLRQIHLHSGVIGD